MKRSILAILSGLLTAAVLTALLEAAGHLIFPPPQIIDPMDTEALKQMMAQMPLGSLISVVIAWLVAGFTGGFVTAKIDRENHTRSVLTVAVIMTLATIANLIMIPHPLWMMITGPAGYLVCTILGGRVARSH